MRFSLRFMLLLVILIIGMKTSVGQATMQDTVVNDSTWITVKGLAEDPNDPYNFLFLMVVNQKTGQGNFGDPYGRFSLKVQKTDTVLISARGYHIAKVCMADSVYKKEYELTVQMEKLAFSLEQVDVYPERDIEEIEEDIDNLGTELAEMQPIDGVEAVFSPITALYQRFSKIEKSKRLVAEMENEDRKRELLKELFRKYIKYDIIDLSPEQFDDFIDYMDLPDSFIKNAPPYDLIMEIKRKYELYSELYGRW